MLNTKVMLKLNVKRALVDLVLLYENLFKCSFMHI